MQPASWKVREFYDVAEERLQQPLTQFTPVETNAIADALARIIRELKYTCYACAIMPDHVHILIRKHKHLAEEMIVNLQSSAAAGTERAR